MPFSAEDFLRVFASYNTAVFPLQILFYLLAICCLILVIKPYNQAGRLISAILAFLWLWTGLVYHIIFFSAINKAAYGFGAVFIVQSLLFFYYGVFKNDFEFVWKKGVIGILAWGIILYSLLIYPLLGFIFGHGYPRQPTFGLPCPTTIFTFGILIFTLDRLRWWQYVIPLLWAALGFTAAIKLGIAEDTGLLVSGFLFLGIIIRTGRQRAAAMHEALRL